MNLDDKLRGISLSDEKINELKTKPNLIKNMEVIVNTGNNFTKMQYSLACIAPKNCNLIELSNLIEEGYVTNDSLLKGLVKLGKKSKDEYIDFCKKHTYNEQDIINFIRLLKEKKETKATISSKLKEQYLYYDTKIFLKEMANYNLNVPMEKYTKNWLDEGEIKFLHKPGENPQKTKKIMEDHLKRTGGKVITRFPPEPNGNLHIGHAKALNLSFEYAKKFNGITYLRFDDTNPKNESNELYNGIIEDVKWLGFEPFAITASSDHFEAMHEMAKTLIKKNKSYVCFCSLEEIRARRSKYQKERDEGNDDPLILSPYRNTSVEQNLIEFEKMLKGEYKDGEAVLRFKMPLKSKNPLMLDLVGARIINMVHDRKQKNYIVYPSYEFALCVCDSLEDITHSFCSREFYTRQEPYHWLLQELDMYEPVQWEFSRLNISNTVLSKRKLTKIVDEGLNWDDPRFYTIKGMRRRGFPASAINKFVQSVGITFSETIIDVKILESFVLKELMQIAKKATCIINPLKVYINKCTTGIISNEPVDVNNIIYIDKDDFDETNNSDFLRLTKIQPVGLINLGVLKYIKDESDGIRCELLTVDECKPNKFIQWLPNLDNKVELRMYKPLFKSFDPDEIGYMNDIDLTNSLEIIDGYVDNTVLNTYIEDKFQFIRIGFFCCDFDSIINDNQKKLVFNLTLPLNKNY